MNLTASITKRLIRRKVVFAILITASVAAFATSGGGGKKSSSTSYGSKNFTLRSGYNYKSNNLLSLNAKNYITLNTTITYQRGNATFVLPLKKKVLLDKVKFTPAPRNF
ncbi:MAG TPA: hypothetical protein VFZ78_11525 [Flavisolibacter sp.]